MPRRAREHSQFGYIHVICRGINKQVLFEDDGDYSFYLNLLAKYSRETGVTVNAYCLMDNHVHLLLCDLDQCVATMMKKLGVSYAGYFNKKYERTGHLFQGRFHSVAIENELALKTVFRYILQNPKKAGICSVDEYRWSSYDQYGDDASFVDTSALVRMIGSKAAYRELVGAEVDEDPHALEMQKRDDEWAKAVLARSLHVSNGLVLQNYDKSSRDKALDTLMDLLFPPSLYCHCCGNLIDQTRTYGLCDHCVRHIRWDRGAPLIRDGMVMVRCAEYGIYERSLIFSLKYNGHRYIARSIAEMMTDRLALTALRFDVIVPIPMHRAKQRRRGFNHAALIGKYLSARTGAVCLPEALIRTQDTRPMRGLSPTERENNIRGHIAPGPQAQELEGKRVLLLDDFFTTGATARECRRALAQVKPGDVMLLAFAAKY